MVRALAMSKPWEPSPVDAISPVWASSHQRRRRLSRSFCGEPRSRAKAVCDARTQSARAKSGASLAGEYEGHTKADKAVLEVNPGERFNV